MTFEHVFERVVQKQLSQKHFATCPKKIGHMIVRETVQYTKTSMNTYILDRRNKSVEKRKKTVVII